VTFLFLKDNDDDNNNNKRGRGWKEVEKFCLVPLVQCWNWNINCPVSRKCISRAACDITTVVL
jgi:hypothetical protein